MLLVVSKALLTTLEKGVALLSYLRNLYCTSASIKLV